MSFRGEAKEDIAEIEILTDVAIATILAFYIWGAHWRHLANTTEPSLCGGGVALCQITFDYLLVVVVAAAVLRACYFMGCEPRRGYSQCSYCTTGGHGRSIVTRIFRGRGQNLDGNMFTRLVFFFYAGTVSSTVCDFFKVSASANEQLCPWTMLGTLLCWLAQHGSEA